MIQNKKVAEEKKVQTHKAAVEEKKAIVQQLQNELEEVKEKVAKKVAPEPFEVDSIGELTNQIRQTIKEVDYEKA